MEDDDSERELPLLAAISLFRAQLLFQRGLTSEREMRDSLTVELAAHEDLALVIEAQAVIGAGILGTLETFAPEGVTGESFLLGLERSLSEDN